MDDESDEAKKIENLCKASENGDFDRVLEVVHEESPEFLQNYDAHGWTPLHYASKNNHNDIVQLLLDNYVDIEARTIVAERESKTPLILASDHGAVEVMDTLLQNGAYVHGSCENGRTPFHYASTSPLTGVDGLNVLLKFAAGTMVRDQLGRTPLHGAIHYKDPSKIQFLLNLRVDINAADNFGCTPLHYCMKREINVENFILLLDRKVDTTIQNDALETPFHSGLLDSEPDEEKLKILLDRDTEGSLLELKDRDGHTPFHAAIMKNVDIHYIKRVLDVILENGREIDQVLLSCDRHGRTVFHDSLKRSLSHKSVNAILEYAEEKGIHRDRLLLAKDHVGLIPLAYAQDLTSAELTLIQMIRSKTNLRESEPYAPQPESAELTLREMTKNGWDLHACSREMLIQVLENQTSNYKPPDSVLQYFKSFEEATLAVPGNEELEKESNLAVRLNPQLSQFQHFLADFFSDLTISCEITVSSCGGSTITEEKELPLTIKYVTMGFLSPLDVMQRNSHHEGGMGIHRPS